MSGVRRGSRRVSPWLALGLALLPSFACAEPPPAAPVASAPAAVPATATATATAPATGHAAAGPRWWEPPPAAAERGLRGVLAVRGENELTAENADRLLTPASVAKLLVAATALHHLGPEHRVVTPLRARGEIAGGVLAGDLVVVASGDPTWSERFHPAAPRAPLAALAREVAATGLRRVTGDLVVDLSRFPGRPMSRDRAVSDAPFAFAAPTAALAVDEATVDVVLAAGAAVGAPARLDGSPGLELVNRTRTVGGERQGRGTVDFQPVWGSDTIVARGEFPLGEPSYEIALADPTPERRAGEAIVAALAAAGVEVAGEVRLTHEPASGGRELGRVASPPLREILVPLLEKSHNWLAEMLLRLVAAEVAGEGRDEVGLLLEAELLVGAVGVAPDSFYLVDASGLSPANLLTPRTVVALLAWAWEQPWRDAWVAALPAADEGTLAGWPEKPPLVAKTGTLAHTDALAGYLWVGADRDSPVIFAVLSNHRPAATGRVRGEVVRLLSGWARGE